MEDNLLQQFLPDDSASLRKAIMAAGLGMLGTRAGFETAGIGRAGLLGMGVYERDRQNQMEENVAKMAIAKRMEQEAQQRAAAQQQMASLDALRRGLMGGGMPGAAAPAPGPMADFRTPGGAGALMAGAAMGVPPPTQQLPTQPPPRPRSYADQLNAWADLFEKDWLETNNEASFANAQKYRAEAQKVQEEFSPEIQNVVDAQGNVVGAFGGKGGTLKKLDVKKFVPPRLESTGGALTRFSPYTGESLGVAAPMTMSPSEAAKQDLAEREFRYKQRQDLSGGGPTDKIATELRKEVAALPQVKNYFTVQPVLITAREAVNDDTPAGDMNLIYAVAKVVDPESVVRESDTEMTMNATSPAQKYLGLWKYVTQSGGRLSAETRAGLMRTIESRARGHEENYRAVRRFYEPLAKKRNVDVADVFIEPATTAQKAPNTGNTVLLPDGRVKVFPSAEAAAKFRQEAGL